MTPGCKFNAKRTDITLVILDMIMPGLDAADTYDGLKAINRQVKVLLSSGYGADQQAPFFLFSLHFHQRRAPAPGIRRCILKRRHGRIVFHETFT